MGFFGEDFLFCFGVVFFWLGFLLFGFGFVGFFLENEFSRAFFSLQGVFLMVRSITCWATYSVIDK